MYLTQMPLNPERRSTRDMLSSPQRMHAAVLSAFVPGTVAAGRILWRLDRPERHRLDLYVVSPTQPSLEAMSDQAGWPNQPVWRTADYGPFLSRLDQGQRWVFRLRANPIKNVRTTPDQRGHRTALSRPDQQVEWLVERGERLGFSLVNGEHGPNVRVLEQARDRFARRSGGERRTVTISAAVFEGVLEVRDADRLREALTSGVGAGKGYGCGLMTLAPLR